MGFQFQAPAKPPAEEPSDVENDQPSLDDVIYSISHHGGFPEADVKARIAEKVKKNKGLVTEFGAAMMIVDAGEIPVIKRPPPPPVSQPVPVKTPSPSPSIDIVTKDTGEIPLLLKPIIEGITMDYIAGVMQPLLERIEKKIDKILATPIITPELIATLERIDANTRSIRDAGEAEKLEKMLEEKPAPAEPEKPASKKIKVK
jgi:hypothetical protein